MACHAMQATSQGIPAAQPAEGALAQRENALENAAQQKATQATPASNSKSRIVAVQADDADFTSEIFVRVMEKCFSKDGMHAVVDKCTEAEKEAFQVLEKTRAKPRAARLRLLSTCRPVGCETVADLFLWLVQVPKISPFSFFRQYWLSMIGMLRL